MRRRSLTPEQYNAKKRQRQPKLPLVLWGSFALAVLLAPLWISWLIRAVR